MELNSSLIWLLESLEQDPIIMVFLATFGLLFGSIAVLFILSSVFGILKEYDDNAQAIGSIIAIAFLLGFITQILFLFAEVSGIKMFLIWCVMIFGLSIFGILNRKKLANLMNELAVIKDFT